MLPVDLQVQGGGGGSSKETEKEWPEVEGEPGEIEVLGIQGRGVTKDEWPLVSDANRSRKKTRT